MATMDGHRAQQLSSLSKQADCVRNPTANKHAPRAPPHPTRHPPSTSEQVGVGGGPLVEASEPGRWEKFVIARSVAPHARHRPTLLERHDFKLTTRPRARRGLIFQYSIGAGNVKQKKE